MSCSARLPVYTLLISAFLARDFPWWVPAFAMFCLYLLGLIVAPLVALCLKATLLRGETPPFVMEMPLYKRPSPVLVVRRAFDASWEFIARAGTVILATMIVIWALLYFPNVSPEGTDYETQVSQLDDSVTEGRTKLDKMKAEFADGSKDKEVEALGKEIEETEDKMNELTQHWKSGSILGQAGHALEPAVQPLGWDWRIALSVLAAFPAREAMVGTLGLVYGEGDVDSQSSVDLHRLSETMQKEKAYTVPVALSVLVFFALCCQCVSTLAVIRRETGGWAWPAFTFVYLTVLAYAGAFVTYQVGTWILGATL
jgi:ferrous iron transport protein B